MTCAYQPKVRNLTPASALSPRSLAAFGVLIFAISAAAPICLQAQAPAPPAPSTRVDLAPTFNEERSLKAGTEQSFWLTGGALEIGANLYKGLGVALNVTGSTATSIGSSGVPVSLVTVAAGPRYRWHADRRISVYGEGLAGEASGFRSFFPTSAGGQTSSNSLAVQVGGGVDVNLNKRFAARFLEASYVRTILPNATDTQQNILRVGAGIVLRFGH